MIAALRANLHASVALRDLDRLAPELDLPARSANVRGERVSDLAVIDHSRVGRVQRANAENIRLDRAELVAVEHAQACDAVGAPATFELRQPSQFRVV